MLSKKQGSFDEKEDWIPLKPLRERENQIFRSQTEKGTFPRKKIKKQASDGDSGGGVPKKSLASKITKKILSPAKKTKKKTKSKTISFQNQKKKVIQSPKKKKKDQKIPQKSPALTPVIGYAVLDKTNYLVKLKTIGRHNWGRPGVINDHFAQYHTYLAAVLEVSDVESGQLLTGRPIEKLKQQGITGTFFRSIMAAQSHYWSQRAQHLPWYFTGEIITAEPITGLPYWRSLYVDGNLIEQIEYLYHPSGQLQTNRRYSYDQSGRKRSLRRRTYNLKGELVSQYKSRFAYGGWTHK